MSRIPTHTVEDAPAASRPLLQKNRRGDPDGTPREPACLDGAFSGILTAYTSLRAVLAEHTSFGRRFLLAHRKDLR